MRVGGGRGVFGIGLISSPMTLPLLAPYLGKHHQPDRSIALPPAPEHALPLAPPSFLYVSPPTALAKADFRQSALGTEGSGWVGLGQQSVRRTLLASGKFCISAKG